MLISLQIEQIAVIRKASLELGPGFLVLSGETGAGKSIIIDSINMVLGERTSKELIRTGEEKAKVQALFSLSEEVRAQLEDQGVDCEDGQVLISRELYRDGRSVCRMNGELTAAGTVKAIAPLLLNIHGQHDNQALLQNQKHIELIDGFAKNKTEREACKDAFQKVKEVESQIELLEASEGNEQLMELYRYQMEEIEGAELRIGEEEELRDRLKLLEHSETVAQNASQSYEYLYGNEGAHDSLSRAADALGKAALYDKELESVCDSLSEAVALLDDASHQLRQYTERMEHDPEELDRVQSRLEEIRKLERKYGATEEAVLQYYNEIKEKAEGFSNSEEKLNQLRRELEEKKKVLTEKGAVLSETRKKAAVRLEQEVMEQLVSLDMGKMKFSVSFTPCEIGEKGGEKVVFLLSSNPGEELKELSKIASGGELSRIMLALKSVLADADSVGTLIFDEIDTGVSGRAAQKIADKLTELSRHRQVLCITHLPQIAAMADEHFLIEKQEIEGRSATKVTRLMHQDRLEELARMLGGVSVTELTVAAAEQMLEQATLQKGRN